MGAHAQAALVAPGPDTVCFVLQHSVGAGAAAAAAGPTAASDAAAAVRHLYLYDPLRAEEAYCFYNLCTQHTLAHSELDSTINLSEPGFSALTAQEKHALTHVYTHHHHNGSPLHRDKPVNAGADWTLVQLFRMNGMNADATCAHLSLCLLTAACIYLS
jgi:hypothetical protein